MASALLAQTFLNMLSSWPCAPRPVQTSDKRACSAALQIIRSHSSSAARRGGALRRLPHRERLSRELRQRFKLRVPVGRGRAAVDLQQPRVDQLQVQHVAAGTRTQRKSQTRWPTAAREVGNAPRDDGLHDVGAVLAVHAVGADRRALAARERPGLAGRSVWARTCTIRRRVRDSPRPH